MLWTWTEYVLLIQIERAEEGGSGGPEIEKQEEDVKVADSDGKKSGDGESRSKEAKGGPIWAGDYVIPSTGHKSEADGREALDQAFVEIFGAESIIVRSQRLAVAGAPYDTLEEVIGIRDENGLGSLKDFGIKYREVALADDGGLDWDALEVAIKPPLLIVILLFLFSSFFVALHNLGPLLINYAREGDASPSFKFIFELLLNEEEEEEEEEEEQDDDNCSYGYDISDTEKGDHGECRNPAKKSEDILLYRTQNGLIFREFTVKETHKVVRPEDENRNKMANDMLAFHKSHPLKLRVAPSETAMTDVLCFYYENVESFQYSESDRSD
ncbi:hypothetical protein L1887_28910 [Cichorium endivia]|nr:hypothetical protein L1887_28910 [Cichorium endivia]